MLADWAKQHTECMTKRDSMPRCWCCHATLDDDCICSKYMSVADQIECENCGSDEVSKEDFDSVVGDIKLAEKKDRESGAI